MSLIIDNYQGAFIHERQINDGMLIAAELIDSRMKENKNGIICRVDFEKAFDNINWNCVDIVLERFGFGNIWRGWIKWCITQARFAVLINGEATSMFKNYKGIRQGDPISPFIFIMVAEILSKMISKAASNGLLSGFQVETNSTTITHLQFADDLMVFLDDSTDQVTNLKNVLFAFQLISDLKVNYRKSAIAGIGDENNGLECADVLGCDLLSLPINYLGIPLGSKSKSGSVWDIIIQRCRQKLSSWKRRYLSKGQRLILINGVIASLPIYYLSMFQMPASVTK